MSDRTSTKAYFLVGPLAALVLALAGEQTHMTHDTSQPGDTQL